MCTCVYQYIRTVMVGEQTTGKWGGGLGVPAEEPDWGGGVPPPPSPKYPLVAPLGTSLQGGGEGVGGVLSSPHLHHTTQPKGVAYRDSAHIWKGHLVSGKLCRGWDYVRGEKWTEIIK